LLCEMNPSSWQYIMRMRSLTEPLSDSPRTPIDLRLLQVFLAVSAGGSMTGAAQRLGLTQSAVSQSLRQLEGELQVPLFARDRRPLLLTAAGRLLLDRASRLIEEAHRLPGLMPEISSAALPEIRVGFVDSFAATVGPHLVRVLLESAVRLSVYAGVSPLHEEALRKRNVEIIVSNDPLYELDGVERHLILCEPFIMLAPRAIAHHMRRLALGEIAGRYPLLRYSARSRQGAQVERHLRRLRINPPRTVEIDNSDMLVAMVAAGCGWAITTPLCYLQGRAHAGTTVPLPLPGPEFSRSLTLIARAGRICRAARPTSRRRREAS
jgi:DNA-binding transcriptional LysR family regulator